ncbi:putative manganese-dependent inorganic diphosphatase [Alkaliphilus peptidifermentans]|uniref:inorganic diphosphatase n=1 Tax=Alkaliphilus peptidifermentans DSM 18978 TaxID=1120976 RepID=A0A1G5KYU4_9FIRM|nr:putative manganese-dependent inorganic diphosphatase [Alkaliphilus peptidifermentans]SCZ05746.1 manganese-dependent inorganic pyrophosphatase [Alkaliphilus peptidifermentans DSM 18978]
MSTFIIGHRNPDTDSVASAIGLSYLKNQLMEDTIPCVIGNLNKESEFVLNYFNMPNPKLIEDVKTQVKDLKHDVIEGLPPSSSILHAYKLMEEEKLETLPILDAKGKLLGIVSMKDIAMGLIKGDFYRLNTSLQNLVDDLNGQVLSGGIDEIEGNLSVIAYYYKTIEGILKNNDIIIVGDRYDIIEYAVESKVKLIIITGSSPIPAKYIDMAIKNNVTMLLVPHDTYFVSKIVNQCNYISTIMRNKDIIEFNQNDYLDEVKEEMGSTHFRNYPVVDDSNTFIGFINRRHMMNSGRKNVILVDHNEYSQSVNGLREAEILEIIDHHKLGDISTSMPIAFRNSPVGSTCTIIYQMFKEYNIEVPYPVAGILVAGIISDTLYLKSPTTTEVDRLAVTELNMVLNMDLDTFAMDMFKAGTSLEGESVEEIFFKDFKEFKLESCKIGISQVFTLDIDDVLNRKEEFNSFIYKVYSDKGHDLTLLLITDILNKGSYLLYHSSNQHLVPMAFNIQSKEIPFVEGLVSRKKQVLPQLQEALYQLR